MASVVVGALGDFREGRAVAIEAAGRRLVLVRRGERVFAVVDRCSHRGFPLHDGRVGEDGIRCRTHGSCFDLTSGEVLRGPARRAIRTYPTAIVDGEVVVEIT